METGRLQRSIWQKSSAPMPFRLPALLVACEDCRYALHHFSSSYVVFGKFVFSYAVGDGFRASYIGRARANLTVFD